MEMKNRAEKVQTIHHYNKNGMPERWYGLGRQHDQRIQEVILAKPPINTNNMGGKGNRDSN